MLRLILEIRQSLIKENSTTAEDLISRQRVNVDAMLKKWKSDLYIINKSTPTWSTHDLTSNDGKIVINKKSSKR